MTIRPHLPAAVLAICIALPAVAQTPQPRSIYDRHTEPIQIFKTGLGAFTKPISSTNKEAQAFFDQGFQMMYAFAKPEAVRSFREAWKRDADCAICYWGEAWAWGSYLNAPMNADESPHAYAAAQKALSLKNRATTKERSTRLRRPDCHARVRSRWAHHRGFEHRARHHAPQAF